MRRYSALRTLIRISFLTLCSRSHCFSGYYHPLFLKGRGDLVSGIHRIRFKGAGPRKACDTVTEHEFYALSAKGEQAEPEFSTRLNRDVTVLTSNDARSDGSLSSSTRCPDIVPMSTSQLHLDDLQLLCDFVDEEEENLRSLLGLPEPHTDSNKEPLGFVEALSSFKTEERL